VAEATDQSVTGSPPRAVSVAGELLQATEMAALAAASGAGRDEPEPLRQRAIQAMSQALTDAGLVVSPHLGLNQDRVTWTSVEFAGARLPTRELAAYPVEGARLAAAGSGGAISLLVAVAPGSVPHLPPLLYMEKIVAGPVGRGALDLDDEIGDNLRRLAFARDARVSDLLIAVLDRPRHQGLIGDIRATGARVVLLEEGELAGALLAASRAGAVDAMVGIGGLHETIVEAGLARCLGGEIVARLWPRNEEERELAMPNLDRTYAIADLAPTTVEAAATGVTDSLLLHGARFGSPWNETESLSLSTLTRTARTVLTRHWRGS
jgi:fructose-1,6-bisphosphatase/sedoheptulose 1,7-bisphosphatase-like protein